MIWTHYQRKNIKKVVKKAVSTSWLSLHVSVDGVRGEYVGLLETLNLLEEEGGSGGSMAKGFVKKMRSSKFIGMLYTLKVMLPSLTALSKTFQTGAINFSRIILNVIKTKTKLQQLFDEGKTMKLLKDDPKTRLKRCNLQIDEEKEEKMNSLTERYIKAMIWNIDERFPSDVLQIIDAFSISDLEKVPTDHSSSEFSICACNELEVLCKHFFGDNDEKKTAFVEEWGNFKFELMTMKKKWFQF